MALPSAFSRAAASGAADFIAASLTTTDDAWTILDSIEVAEGESLLITAHVAGVAQNNAAAGYGRSALVRRLTGGNVELIGSVSEDFTEETAAVTGWDCTIDVDTATQTVRVKVKGQLDYDEAGDTENQLSNWDITGVNATNSDNGKLEWLIRENSSPTTYEVALIDGTTPQWVAAGEISTTSGTVTFSEQYSSGISGTVDLDFTTEKPSDPGQYVIVKPPVNWAAKTLAVSVEVG